MYKSLYFLFISLSFLFPSLVFCAGNKADFDYNYQYKEIEVHKCLCIGGLYSIMTCLNKMDTPARLNSGMMDGDTQKEEIALMNPACVLAHRFSFFFFRIESLA